MRLFLTLLIIAEYAAIIAGRIDPLVLFLTAFVLLFIFRSNAIVILGAGLGLLLDLFHPLPGIYFVIYPLILAASNVILGRIITHRSIISYFVMYIASLIVYCMIETSVFWVAGFSAGSPLVIDPATLILHKVAIGSIWLIPSLLLYAMLRKMTEIRYGYGIESREPMITNRV